MKTYSQLSQEERYILASWKARGTPMRNIALYLGRHVSTLYREWRRNLRPSGRYAAFVAHSYATARNHACHRGSQFSEAQWDRVKSLLAQDFSPEQVSNVLRLTGEFSISVPTIYRMVKKDRRRHGKIYKRLRIYPKTRRKRYRSVDYRGKLKGKRPISDRPPGAQDRSEFGHWEGDTVMGAGHYECILTLVERKTGLARTAKILHRTAAQTNAAISRILAAEPHLFKTITFDNGTEFHSYKRLEAKFPITCYFAAPHHPWERGTNENFNGLLRQYFPKGGSLASIGDKKINRICEKLNNRPRKRLGYKSPQEAACDQLSISHLVV